MDKFMIAMSLVLVFFAGLAFNMSSTERDYNILKTIPEICQDTTDEYTKGECSIWERTYRNCMKEEIGTEGFERCTMDVLYAEHNIFNSYE